VAVPLRELDVLLFQLVALLNHQVETVVPDLVIPSRLAVALLVALLDLQVEIVAVPDLVTPSRLAMVQACKRSSTTTSNLKIFSAVTSAPTSKMPKLLGP
jgi:hypothetical protein